MDTTTTTTTTIPRPAPLSAEAADPHCLDPGEAARLLAGTPWRSLAVLGDSIASGVGDPAPGYPDLSWADRLSLTLGEVGGPVSYLNTGVRGARAAEIRRDQLGRALAVGPDVAVVVAGGNDMLGRRFDPEGVAAELDAMIGALRAGGAEVVTFGLFDLSRAPFVPDELGRSLGRATRALNATTAAVAARHGALHVDFSRHPAGPDATIWSADLLHLNRRGHAIVHTEVVRALAARAKASA